MRKTLRRSSRLDHNHSPLGDRTIFGSEPLDFTSLRHRYGDHLPLIYIPNSSKPSSSVHQDVEQGCAVRTALSVGRLLAKLSACEKQDDESNSRQGS